MPNNTPATPGTIGGRFTHIIAFFSAPVISSGDGGRTDQAGFNGSGNTQASDAHYLNNGGSAAVSGTWTDLKWSMGGTHFDPWTQPDPYNPPQIPHWRGFGLGSCEPQLSTDGFLFTDTNLIDTVSPFGGTFAFFDNGFATGVGPHQTVLRSAREWVTVANDPANGTADTGAVLASITNQFSFPRVNNLIQGIPISQFGSIFSYHSSVDPFSSVPPASNTAVQYDGSWDTYGHAHVDKTNTDGSLAISFECQFYTRNYNQGPFGPLFVQVETGIDLNDDGLLWDLWTTFHVIADGGVAQKYSYAIWVLEPAFQTSTVWVNLLAGIRYFASRYVITTPGTATSGQTVPASPLDIPLTQIVLGWESCSTNYTPTPFSNLDYKLQMTAGQGSAGPLIQQSGQPVNAPFPARTRGRAGRH